MTLTPDPDEHFVIVWRETGSRRLRTYVSSSGLPISSPLIAIFPETSQAITSPGDLADWLASPAGEETIAISESVARSELGWTPERSEEL